MKVITDPGLGITVLVFGSTEERKEIANQLLSMPDGYLYYCQYPDEKIPDEKIDRFLKNLKKIELSSIYG